MFYEFILLWILFWMKLKFENTNQFTNIDKKVLYFNIFNVKIMLK